MRSKGILPCLLQGHRLKYTVISINSLSLLLAAFIFFPLGTVFNHFGSQCFLFAEIQLDVINDSDNSTLLSVKDDSTVWGKTRNCYFCTYGPVTTAIHAIIWCWFYIQMTTIQDKNETLCALIISCILHSILSVVMVVSSFILSFGFIYFCSAIEASIDDIMTCKETEMVKWSVFRMIDPNSDQIDIFESRRFYTRINIAQICSWFLTCVLLVESVLAGYLVVSLVKRDMSSDGKYEPCNTKDNFGYDSDDGSHGYNGDMKIHDDTGSFQFNQDIEYCERSMEHQHTKL